MSYETARSHHVVEDPAQERLCRALRSLPARIPPAGLTTNLRVIASRERKRFLDRRTLPQAFASWYQHSNVTFGQMIRNAALPVMGGVCTAVILFSTWLVPTYPLQAKSGVDVPTMLTTAAGIPHAELGLAGGDADVDLILDSQGSVVGYDMVTGGDALQDPERLRRIKSRLPLLRFTPATEFGRPTASRVRLRLSQIDSSVVFVED
jgi:hypothetical protein